MSLSHSKPVFSRKEQGGHVDGRSVSGSMVRDDIGESHHVRL